jgi:hypothetical protein
MKNTNYKAMAIAMALPSSLLGLILFIKKLVESKIISETVGYIVLIISVIYFFYLMIRFANEDKN